MNKNERENLIREIRSLAGRIGADDELPNVADSVNYEYQVDTGLASAVAELLFNHPQNAIPWFGYCLIECGVDIDERMSALMDALRREVDSQLDEEDDETESP